MLLCVCAKVDPRRRQNAIKTLILASSVIEQFSLECRKAIGFAFCTPHDWLKKLALLFHPLFHPHAFSRALRQLHVITSSFDSFT